MNGEDLADYSSEICRADFHDAIATGLSTNCAERAGMRRWRFETSWRRFRWTEGWGLARRNALHAMIEAKKLAYADLVKYIGIEKAETAGATLISKEWRAEGAKRIDLESCELRCRRGRTNRRGKRYDVFERGGPRRKMVSMIQSNYESFGSESSRRALGLRCTSGRAVQHGSVSPNRAGRGGKRPLQHDYSCVLRRRVTRGWRLDHGRVEPVAGPRSNSSRICDSR